MDKLFLDQCLFFNWFILWATLALMAVSGKNIIEQYKGNLIKKKQNLGKKHPSDGDDKPKSR